jgi:hypothetical protein
MRYEINIMLRWYFTLPADCVVNRRKEITSYCILCAHIKIYLLKILLLSITSLIC